MQNVEINSNVLKETFGHESRWVNYQIVEREGKKTKLPLNPLTGKMASSTHANDWTTYDIAIKKSSKVGIVFTSDKTLLGIDIDHCLKDGEIVHEQKETIEMLVNEANSYTEISPSGDGLHIILSITAPLELEANRKSPYEFYTCGRYFTVTNKPFKEVRQVRAITPSEAVELLSKTEYPWKGVANPVKEIKTTEEKSTSNKDYKDNELLQEMFTCKIGEQIKSLYNGDTSQQDSDTSKADFALCSHLAFWTRKNSDQIERMWLASPLGQREKTQKRKDYRDSTIKNAIEQCKEERKKPRERRTREDKELDGEKEVKKFKTTIITKEYLYETVNDLVKNKTSYVRVDKNGTIVTDIYEVEIGDEKYIPLPAIHDFISKRVVLFPSCIKEFSSEKELLRDIQTFIHKYLDISETYERIASYYVLFTWLYDQFYEVPYLRALGDFGSGKSRFLQTIGSISYKPIFASGATTTSPLFRIIDEMNGTLILDEADFNKSDTSAEIIKILNTGYQKGVGVMRSEGKGTFEVKVYNVYGPKIIATRETFGDKALESRCLVEEMGKSSLRAGIPLTTHKNFPEEALELRNQLLMWRLKNYFKDFEIEEEVIPGIHPRLNQIVLPLFSIIKDEDVKQELIGFITKYNENLTGDRGMSRESDIIFHILKIQHESFTPNELTMKEIAESINKDNDSSEEEISPRKIGWYLRAKLQLKTQRSRRGFVLDLKTESNIDRLLFWKERFGITDADIKGEDENVVNVVNGVGKNIF